MKNVLIVIQDMKVGGAQKSLLSFLQSLAGSERAKEYAVDLLIIRPEGEFLDQIPQQVNIIAPDRVLRWMGAAMNKQLITRFFSMRAMLGEMGWIVRRRLKLFPKGLNIQQQLWENWKRLIPDCGRKYDAAVAYIDGVPNYYIMSKVRAEKKVLWFHSEYQKQGYAPWYDRAFLEDSDAIVTISETCKGCIRQEFPHLDEKIHILENISSSAQLIRRSMDGECPEYAGTDGLKILTVGRLHKQKGMDIAVEAARVLRENGLRFRWLVAGDGSERPYLQQKIDEYGLADCFELLGTRPNPYVYMRACDVLVQPSRVEGKSIVLDEAKILCKPIVATSYTTVYDAIEHGKSGWIVDMNGQALAEGIMHLAQDAQLRADLTAYLQAQPKGNEAELQRYIDVML